MPLITTNNLDSVQVVSAQDNQFQTFNDKVGELDSFLTEALSVSVSASNATITAADYRRYRKIRVTGNTTAGRSVTLQAIKREVLIDNSDAANTQSIAIKLGSTTLNLAAGKKAFFETDGTANGLELVISNDAAGGGAFVAKAGDTMTGPLAISDATASTSPTTGALIVVGGVGVNGGVTVAGGTSFASPGSNGIYLGTNGGYAQVKLVGTTPTGAIIDFTEPSTDYHGRIIFSNSTNILQLAVAGVTGRVDIPSATASSSFSTGALTVAGGLGVAGDIYCGGTISGITLIPQNSQNTAYTTVLADAGKHLLHPSADTTARTFTIASNASVAYPIGTAITFVNQNSAGVLTIAITSDTMRLAGAGTTGSRTLAANGVATALKITSTEWIISGTGLT